MKINFLIALAFVQPIFATNPSDIKAYKIDDRLIQINIMHYITEGSETSHFVNEVKATYQGNDLCDDTEFKDQEMPNIVTVFVPCYLTLNSQHIVVQIGDNIQVVATCNHGGKLTKNVKVEKLP
jgi:hypothetical protein